MDDNPRREITDQINESARADIAQLDAPRPPLRAGVWTRSTDITSAPAAPKRLTTTEPIKPQPPVTSTRQPGFNPVPALPELAAGHRPPHCCVGRYIVLTCGDAIAAAHNAITGSARCADRQSDNRFRTVVQLLHWPHFDTDACGNLENRRIDKLAGFGDYVRRR
jgi:hypothetical protein